MSGCSGQFFCCIWHRVVLRIESMDGDRRSTTQSVLGTVRAPIMAPHTCTYQTTLHVEPHCHMRSSSPSCVRATCACACVCVWVHAKDRVCVCVCAHMSLCMCVGVLVCACVCVCACARSSPRMQQSTLLRVVDGWAPDCNDRHERNMSKSSFEV